LPHSVFLAYDYASSKKPLEVDQTWVDSFAKLHGKTLWIKPHFAPPSGSNPPEKSMTEPFWAARKEAAGGDIPGSLVLSELNIAGSHTTVAKGDVEKRGGVKNIQWKVPVLTNPSDLKSGTELWWAGGIKKKRTQVSLKLDVAGAKKQKTLEIKE
jgi:hypothetical protein